MKKTLSFEKDLTFQTMIGEVTTISFEEDLKFIDKSNIEGNFYVSGKYKMTEASTILEDFSYSIPIEITTIENYDLTTTAISVESFTYEVIDDDVLRCKIDILIEGREEVVLEEEMIQDENENQKTEDDNRISIIEIKKSKEKEGILEQNINKEDLQQEIEIKEEEITEEKDKDTKSNIEQSPEEVELSNDKKDAKEVEKIEQCNERECDGDEILDKKEEDLPIKNKVDNNKKIDKEEILINQEEIEKENSKKEEKSENNIMKNNQVDQEERPTIKVNSLFANIGEEGDTFTTYSIYIMREGDTLEKVMDKYKIKKEELEIYNDLGSIELNSKVIIPTNNNE